jgi:hypothetical protein
MPAAIPAIAVGLDGRGSGLMHFEFSFSAQGHTTCDVWLCLDEFMFSQFHAVFGLT